MLGYSFYFVKRLFEVEVLCFDIIWAIWSRFNILVVGIPVVLCLAWNDCLSLLSTLSGADHRRSFCQSASGLRDAVSRVWLFIFSFFSYSSASLHA